MGIRAPLRALKLGKFLVLLGECHLGSVILIARFMNAFARTFSAWPPVAFALFPNRWGLSGVVYGDKVINLSNHTRDGKRVYPPQGALGYLANGEIGLAVGQWKTKGFPKF